MDACAAGGIYRHLRGAGVDPVSLQCHLYRAAHGCELGRAGGGFSGAFPVRSVLEADDEGGLLGEFSVIHGGDVSQYFLPPQLSGASAVAHQCRRILHAGRACDRAGGERGDESARTEETG